MTAASWAARPRCARSSWQTTPCCRCSPRAFLLHSEAVSADALMCHYIFTTFSKSTACSSPFSLSQVHGAGLRHIKADRRVNEWRAPGRRTIVKAATNERQVSLANSYLLHI